MKRNSLTPLALTLVLILATGCANESRADRGPSAPSPPAAGLAANPASDQSQPPIWAVKGEVLVTNRLDIDFSKYQVTFIELGADRCIPCTRCSRS